MSPCIILQTTNRPRNSSIWRIWLYTKAKEVRRGSFRSFDKALHDEERRRQFLKREMEEVVLDEEFHLVYQPKIDSRTGVMTGCEALLRWRNRKTGPVPPSEFIPIAESSGQILPISEWVVDAVCRELTRWSGTCLEGVSIAVNIAPVMLQSTNLFEMDPGEIGKIWIAARIAGDRDYRNFGVP